jgi:hypothetical protein
MRDALDDLIEDEVITAVSTEASSKGSTLSSRATARDNVARPRKWLLPFSMAHRQTDIVASQRISSIGDVIGSPPRHSIWGRRRYMMEQSPCSRITGSSSPIGHPMLARKRWRILTAVALTLMMPLMAAAMGAVIRVEDRIPIEKFDLVKQHIALLRDVPIETIRYFELTGNLMIVRLEDNKYCRSGDCVTFVINGTISSYAAVYVQDVAFMTAALTSLGTSDGDGDRGSVVAFNTGQSDKRGSEIRVFVSENLVAVLP